MAFTFFSTRCGFPCFKYKCPNLCTQIQGTKRRQKKFCHTHSEHFKTKYPPQFKRISQLAWRSYSSDLKKSSSPSPPIDSTSLSNFAVTDQIQFYRDTRNPFSEMTFSNGKEPYGPPLAILLPWNTLNSGVLKKLIEIYGEKGFDVLTVNVSPEQLLHPGVAGGAMNVVTDLLVYLKETHCHRPYIFHGFSVGAYIFGEIMAQFSDQYELYRGLTNNIRGCLWDSPVDIVTVKSYVGKHFYPKNWFRRWRCNSAVRRHFKKHHHDSVCYWLRSRHSFSHPLVKVPNVFFVSYTDVLSNPCSLEGIQKTLDCNGVPVFQKIWWDSEHTRHFEKYCYEYSYGMTLFLNLSNLFPDDCGKYRTSQTYASLTNMRLSKKARENISR